VVAIHDTAAPRDVPTARGITPTQAHHSTRKQHHRGDHITLDREEAEEVRDPAARPIEHQHELGNNRRNTQQDKSNPDKLVPG
jgi:hypothetical protein